MASTELQHICIFCDQGYPSKLELQEHFRTHGRYSRKISPPRAKVSERIKCEHCNDTFASISMAINHQFRKHRNVQVKHVCPWCGSPFPLKHTYDVHLETHKEEKSKFSFFCDPCNVEFYTQKAIAYHNSINHNNSTSMSMPSILPPSKKLHMNNAGDIFSVYYCQYCGQEYVLKFNLLVSPKTDIPFRPRFIPPTSQRHIQAIHANSLGNMPESILKCNLCDAMFYNEAAYDLHNSYHSESDMYVVDEEMRLNVITKIDQDFDLRRVRNLYPGDNRPMKMQKPVNMKSIQRNQAKVSNSGGSPSNFSPPPSDCTDSEEEAPKSTKPQKKTSKDTLTFEKFISMHKDVFSVPRILDIPQTAGQTTKKSVRSSQATVEKSPSADANNKDIKNEGEIVIKIEPGDSPPPQPSKRRRSKSTNNTPVKPNPKVLKSNVRDEKSNVGTSLVKEEPDQNFDHCDVIVKEEGTDKVALVGQNNHDSLSPKAKMIKNINLILEDEDSQCQKIKWCLYCMFCNDIFIDKTEKEEHIMYFHKEVSGIVNCEYCNRAFKTVLDCTCHVFEKHLNTFLKYACEWCSKEFPLKRSYYQHLHVHKTRMYDSGKKLMADSKKKCTECDIEFCNSKICSLHNMINHPKDFLGLNPSNLVYVDESGFFQPVFFCALCGLEFISMTGLKEHITVRHDDDCFKHLVGQEVKCSECNAVFLSNIGYKTHTRFHRAKKRYIVVDKRTFSTFTATNTSYKIATPKRSRRRRCEVTETEKIIAGCGYPKVKSKEVTSEKMPHRDNASDGVKIGVVKPPKTKSLLRDYSKIIKPCNVVLERIRNHKSRH